MNRAVFVRRFLPIHVLNIVGNDNAADCALSQRDTQGAIEDMTHLRWRRDSVHVFMRHILEQRNQVDFLLVTASQRCTFLLTDNGHYRLMIQLSVIQAIQQMDRAWAGSSETNTDFASEL